MGERTLDANRFDELARSLGHRRTRRGALGLLGGATGLALAGADAKRRGRRGSKRGGVAPAAESAVCQEAGSKTCAVSQVKRAASVRSCDYAGADLAGLSLNGGAASRASFAGATMTGMNLAGANLASACFADADLQGANLRGTNLTGADLTGADLRRADLRGSSASDAQIATAVVSCGTTLPNAKHPPCPDGTVCVDGDCTSPCSPPCGAHEVCQGNACVCAPGWTPIGHDGECLKLCEEPSDCGGACNCMQIEGSSNTYACGQFGPGDPPTCDGEDPGSCSDGTFCWSGDECVHVCGA